MPKQFQEIL